MRTAKKIWCKSINNFWGYDLSMWARYGGIFRLLTEPPIVLGERRGDTAPAAATLVGRRGDYFHIIYAALNSKTLNYRSVRCAFGFIYIYIQYWLGRIPVGTVRFWFFIELCKFCSRVERFLRVNVIFLPLGDFEVSELCPPKVKYKLCNK